MLFDLARCVAIVLVVASHVAQVLGARMGDRFGLPGFYYVSIGGVGVTLFLIVSGAVLELQHGSTPPSYRSFVFRRLLRIYPIYELSLVMAVAIYAIREDFSVLNWSDIPLSLTGFYAFAGRWGGPFVATSWFIGLIVTLYLLFPALSLWVKKRPLVWLSVTLLVSVVCRLVLGRYEDPGSPITGWFPLCRIFEFSLGIWLGSVLAGRTAPSDRDWGVAGAVIKGLSALSFPLFLIHFPLLYLIGDFRRYGVPLPAAIVCYLIVAVLASWAALAIDGLIPKARLRRLLAREPRET